MNYKIKGCGDITIDYTLRKCLEWSKSSLGSSNNYPDTISNLDVYTFPTPTQAQPLTLTLTPTSTY